MQLVTEILRIISVAEGALLGTQTRRTIAFGNEDMDCVNVRRMNVATSRMVDFNFRGFRLNIDCLYLPIIIY